MSRPSLLQDWPTGAIGDVEATEIVLAIQRGEEPPHAVLRQLADYVEALQVRVDMLEMGKDAPTWHYGSTPEHVIIGASLYRLEWDADGAHWFHVAGPLVDEDQLSAVAYDVCAYEYHPSMARMYRAGKEAA